MLEVEHTLGPPLFSRTVRRHGQEMFSLSLASALVLTDEWDMHE